jgi:HAD superfamily phosphoserine phosphatase-like hydrolase
MYRRVALCDFDGTHFRETLEVSLTDHLIARGIVPESAFAKSREIRRSWKRRDSSYEQLTEAHWQEVSEAFKGLRVEMVQAVAREMIDEIGGNVYTFTRLLIKAMHACDIPSIGISGSNREVAEIFGKAHGYDRVVATEYAREDGVYVGGVAYWPGEGQKRGIAQQVLAEYGADPEQCIAIGDTVNDLGMLKSVGHAIAFNATRELESLVRASSSEWSRPIGLVTERKDRVRIERFFPDKRSKMQARECPLEDFLPVDVAAKLRELLGPMCPYDGR